MGTSTPSADPRSTRLRRKPTPFEAPSVRKMSSLFAGTPSRAVMKLATCSRTMAKPWLSLYAPRPFGIAARYSFARAIASGSKSCAAAGFSIISGWMSSERT